MTTPDMTARAIAEARARAALTSQIEAILLENGWAQSVDRGGLQLPFGRIEGNYWIVNGRPNGVDDHVGVAGPGAEFADPVLLTYALVERARVSKAPPSVVVEVPALPAEPALPPEPDPRDIELAALRERLMELEDALKDAVADAHADMSMPDADALMVDFGPVGNAADLADIMLPDEALGDAVERMTPGLDELLDMAQLLSEPSFEAAITTIPAERFNEWTERLFAERGLLRNKRGTEDENLARENLISRVATVFARVGAKR